MKAIIPAAGYATRLFPLTKDKPKALLEVKGKPIVEHIIRRIEQLGAVDEIFIVTNGRFYKNFTDWLAGFRQGARVRVFNDGTGSNETRLGQIGDIQFAIERGGVDDDLLVIAGDNLFNFSLVPAFDFFRKKRAIVNALYDIKSIEAARELGVMSIDRKSNLVVSFEEKPQQPKSTTVSLGIYFFRRKDVKLLKGFLAAGGNPDKIGNLMAELAKKRKLYGFAYLEKWFDIGVPAALEEARREFVPI